MKLEDAIGQFLQHAEIGRNQSEKTIENYGHYLGRFLAWTGDISVGSISLKKVQEYRLYLNRLKDEKGKKLLMMKTQNYHVIALRAFLKWCMKNDIDTLSPEKIDLGKVEDRTVEYLSREELERLFDAVDAESVRGRRDRAILETLYSTGLRVSELVSLNCDQVDLERREFMVREKQGLCFCPIGLRKRLSPIWRFGMTILILFF